jgi:hypothetical protein
MTGFDGQAKRIIALTWEKFSRRPLDIASWAAPTPMAGTADRIIRWSNVATGMKLDADGHAQTLDHQEWNRARRDLGQGR